MLCGVSCDGGGHSGRSHGGQDPREDDSPARGRLSGHGEVDLTEHQDVEAMW